MIRAEGGRGARPEAYRTWMARVGMEDTKLEGKIGGEEDIQQIFGGFVADLPGLDVILKKLPIAGVPRMIFETTAIGGAGGLATGLGLFVLSTAGSPVLAILIPTVTGFAGGIGIGVFTWATRKATIQDLTRKGLLYDCVIPMDKLAEAHTKSIQTRLGGLIPR